MKKLVVVSDLHYGSIFGMLPPDFETSEGVVAPLNPAQKYLYECWRDFRFHVRKFAPDALIVNGDIVEGKQSKSRGVALSMRMMIDQKNAAIAGLRYLKSALPDHCKMYFVQGTEYHVGENGEAEEDIAAVLGATKYRSVGPGVLVREVLWLNIGGVIIESFHAIGGTSGFYRATALDREMQWSAMSAKDETKGMPKADLVMRSHVHHYLGLEHASKQGLILPSWQVQTRYARKASLHRMIPDIGGVLIEVEPILKRQGENPFNVRKKLYDLPPVPVTKL